MEMSFISQQMQMRFDELNKNSLSGIIPRWRLRKDLAFTYLSAKGLSGNWILTVTLSAAHSGLLQWGVRDMHPYLDMFIPILAGRNQIPDI